MPDKVACRFSDVRGVGVDEGVRYGQWLQIQGAR